MILQSVFSILSEINLWDGERDVESYNCMTCEALRAVGNYSLLFLHGLDKGEAVVVRSRSY